MTTTKTCGTCKKEKELDAFSKKREKYSSKCKECFNLYYREYWKNTEAYEKHKERVNRNRKNRYERYGITEEIYNDMHKKYAGLCWICKEKEITCIDHCHDTKKVRGLLCTPCNTGLGKLGDNLEGIKKAEKYLLNAV